LLSNYHLVGLRSLFFPDILQSINHWTGKQ